MNTRNLILLFITFSTTLTIGQVKGVDFETAIPKGSVVYEQLQRTPDVGMYMMAFDQTPVGLKRCINKVEELLIANDKTISNPTSDTSLLHKSVKSIYDYQNLYSTLSIRYSEIIMNWFFDDHNGSISLVCDDKHYYIFISRI